jgi:hypothetical protein
MAMNCTEGQLATVALTEAMISARPALASEKNMPVFGSMYSSLSILGPRQRGTGRGLRRRGREPAIILVLAANQGRGSVDCADDPRIAAAPAQAGVQRRGDLLVAGIGVRGQQRRGARRDTRCAVPALRGPFNDQRALHRVQRLPRRSGQALDRGDRVSGDLPGLQLAGQHRATVDEHRACATRAFAATSLDPDQAQLRPQERQQALLRAADLARFRVDDGAAHGARITAGQADTQSQTARPTRANDP